MRARLSATAGYVGDWIPGTLWLRFEYGGPQYDDPTQTETPAQSDP